MIKIAPYPFHRDVAKLHNTPFNYCEPLRNLHNIETISMSMNTYNKHIFLVLKIWVWVFPGVQTDEPPKMRHSHQSHCLDT